MAIGNELNITAGKNRLSITAGKNRLNITASRDLLSKTDSRNQQRGPSIYDVHSEGEDIQTQEDAFGRGRGSASYGRPHRKLDPTDVILSSSHAKFFVLDFAFGRNKNWTFFVNIN